MKVVDLGLIHVGVVGVVSRDRRHRVDDDVGVGVALLDGLDEGRVVGDEVRDFHPVSLVPKVMTTRRGFIMATA